MGDKAILTDVLEVRQLNYVTQLAQLVTLGLKSHLDLLKFDRKKAS